MFGCEVFPCFSQPCGYIINDFLYFVNRFIKIYLILFLISPLIIGFIIYKQFFTKDNQISVRKLLRFNSEGIDKALATNIIENTNIIESEL